MTPSGRSSTSTATAERPSGWTAARSTSARASRSWVPPAVRSRRSSTTTSHRGELRIDARRGARCCEESIFDYLSREMRRMRYLSHDLPFDFNCGFVGYFGYELKADCEGNDAHRSSMPDAAFVLRRPADRVRPFRAVHVRPLRRRAGPCRGGRSLDRRDEPAACLARAAERARAGRLGSSSTTAFRLSRSHAQYLEDIATCKQRLRRRRDLRDLPDEQDHGRRRRRAARALPDPAPRQPGAVLARTCASASTPSSAPRPSASSASGAIAGSRRSRSRAPVRAAGRRPRTCAWPRSCAATRRTARRT